MMTRSRIVLFAVCLFGLGCSTVRPVAQRGVDLLENTERSYTVRSAALCGSLVGAVIAMPFSVLLLPSYAFDDAWGWGVREPTETEGASAEGDYAIALPGIPMEYGIGIGSGILAAPFAWVEDAIYGAPGASEGWTEETQEEPPGGEMWEDTDVEVAKAPERPESAGSD